MNWTAIRDYILLGGLMLGPLLGFLVLGIVAWFLTD